MIHLDSPSSNECPVILYALDSRGRIQFVGGALEDLLGFREEDLIGKHYTSIIAPGDIKKAEWRFNERRTGKRSIKGLEVRLIAKRHKKRRSGITYLPLELHASGVYDKPVSSGDKRFVGTYGVLRDPTAQKEEFHALARRVTEVEEAERRRLARELHDQVGQDLTLLGINLNHVRTHLPPDLPANVSAKLEESAGLVTGLMERIRGVMADMDPEVLVDQGLLAALRWYSEKFSSRTRLAVAVQGEDLPNPLPSSVEIALFRIAQEALINVAKHAQAKRVTIRLEQAKGSILLSIEDDGRGFESEIFRRPQGRRRWGLMIMQERARAAGGVLGVESEPGKGARILVEVKR